MHIVRYSNIFITNLLDRAYVAKSRREREGRTLEHISLLFVPASCDTESSHESSSVARAPERNTLAMVVYSKQKTLSPDDPETKRSSM